MTGTVVLTTDARTPGGVRRHLTDLAEALRAKGVDVHLDVSSRRRPERSDRALSAFDGGTDWRVWHHHLANTYDKTAPAILAAARLRGYATVLSEHLARTDASDPTEGTAQRAPGAWTAKTLFKQSEYMLCDMVVTVSAASGRFIRLRYGAPLAKVRVVHNGVSLDGGVELFPFGGEPRFVAVGSIIEQKGFDVLVEASSVAKATWVADVWGEGPHRHSLSCSAMEYGSRVRFRGWSNYVVSIMVEARALVVPSRWEAFPYVILEAMALGRPVVASRVDGVPELVTDGVSGILVDPGDPWQLARALDRLSVDAGLSEQLGVAGRSRAMSFSLDWMTERLMSVYEEAWRRRISL